MWCYDRVSFRTKSITKLCYYVHFVPLHRIVNIYKKNTHLKTKTSSLFSNQPVLQFSNRSIFQFFGFFQIWRQILELQRFYLTYILYQHIFPFNWTLNSSWLLFLLASYPSPFHPAHFSFRSRSLCCAWTHQQHQWWLSGVVLADILELLTNCQTTISRFFLAN